MPQSPGLGFELLTSNQDSKHVTVNASALILEAVSIGVVVSQTNTPPASPTNGQLYIVGTAGTGAFLGQDNKLALYDSTTWYFYSPKTNQTLYNTALASYVRFGGSAWASVSLGGSTSPTTTKGDLIVRDATSDVRQPVGGDGQVLTADSTVANGLKWATPTAFISPTTTKGDLIVRNATADARQAVGLDGQVLTADSTLVNGLKWASPTGFTSPTVAKGDIIVRTATIDTRQPIGLDGQVLTADSTVANGLKWATPTAGSASPTTTAGDLIVRGSAVDQRLPIGTNGQFLVVDTALPEKVKWLTSPVSTAENYIRVDLNGSSVAAFGTTAVEALFDATATTTGSPGLAFTASVGTFTPVLGSAARFRLTGVIYVQATTAGTRFQFFISSTASAPTTNTINFSQVGGGVVTAAATPTPIVISGFLDLPAYTSAPSFGLQVRASAAGGSLSATNTGATFPIVSRLNIWRV